MLCYLRYNRYHTQPLQQTLSRPFINPHVLKTLCGYSPSCNYTVALHSHMPYRLFQPNYWTQCNGLNIVSDSAPQQLYVLLMSLLPSPPRGTEMKERTNSIKALKTYILITNIQTTTRLLFPIMMLGKLIKRSSSILQRTCDNHSRLRIFLVARQPAEDLMVRYDATEAAENNRPCPFIDDSMHTVIRHRQTYIEHRCIDLHTMQVTRERTVYLEVFT